MHPKDPKTHHDSNKAIFNFQIRRVDTIKNKFKKKHHGSNKAIFKFQIRRVDTIQKRSQKKTFQTISQKKYPTNGEFSIAFPYHTHIFP